MPITKLDLCKPEWLELVFDHRNTEYGAYDLRKHYAGNLLKALGLTVLLFMCFFEGYNIYLQHQPAVKIVQVINDPRVIPYSPTVKPPVTPPAHEIQRPANNTTTGFAPMVVREDPQTVNPPTITQLEETPIGPTDHKRDGINQDLNIIPIGPSGGGTGDKPDESNDVKDVHSIEVMPEPFGGAAAWGKFLQKNVRFPAPAQEAGVGGKVWLSFIVEKDGSISNIIVERGAGYGMDEEAVRVLKLAPAWKPGIQNGHPVRVRFNLPFNFQVPSE